MRKVENRKELDKLKIGPQILYIRAVSLVIGLPSPHPKVIKMKGEKANEGISN